MTFEIITKEQFSASNPSPLMDAEKAGEDSHVPHAPPPHNPDLVWCEFCKGHYNEHHFGREIDE